MQARGSISHGSATECISGLVVRSFCNRVDPDLGSDTRNIKLFISVYL